MAAVEMLYYLVTQFRLPQYHFKFYFHLQTTLKTSEVIIQVNQHAFIQNSTR